MPWYKWLDSLDTFRAGLEPKAEALTERLIEAIKWSWAQMTLLSTLVIMLTFALGGLAWLTLSDRKKLASRAYWRGYKDGKK